MAATEQRRTDTTVSGVLLAYLHRAGFDVASVCEDGPGALGGGTRRRPDVVILDIMLPGMSGSTSRRRRADDDTAAVMVLSAFGDEDDRLLGLDLGADDYMVKPFSPREAVGRVQALLRRAERPAPAPSSPATSRLDASASTSRHDG